MNLLGLPNRMIQYLELELFKLVPSSESTGEIQEILNKKKYQIFTSSSLKTDNQCKCRPNNSGATNLPPPATPSDKRAGKFKGPGVKKMPPRVD